MLHKKTPVCVDKYIVIVIQSTPFFLFLKILV